MESIRRLIIKEWERDPNRPIKDLAAHFRRTPQYVGEVIRDHKLKKAAQILVKKLYSLITGKVVSIKLFTPEELAQLDYLAEVLQKDGYRI